MAGTGSPEVDDDLLRLVDVQEQVVPPTPFLQMLHLIPVGQLVVILNEAHNCRVIRIFQDVVGFVPGTTVMGHQGEQQGAQDAALGGAGAQGDDTGGVVAHSSRLGSIGEEVQQPVAYILECFI